MKKTTKEFTMASPTVRQILDDTRRLMAQKQASVKGAPAKPSSAVSLGSLFRVSAIAA